MPNSEALTSLLALAWHKPASLASPGAGLALALHCVMIREGFSVEESDTAAAGKRVRHSSYSPPAAWQMEGPNEWNFVYSHPGKANRFKLTVSLHEKSGRTFVHASEAGNPNNIQILGLQLDKYIPDASLLRKTDWSDILHNEDALNEFMTKYVVGPLLDNAEDVPPLAATLSRPSSPARDSPRSPRGRARRAHSPSGSSPTSLEWMGALPAGYLVGASVGLGVVAAAAAALVLFRTAQR
mmetsp:Transcript_27634/g.70399  ORF Transcript_27634/g.70399 Transcript_27634/m.70399 type:complete len:240 (-) Transcript_27634:877-1596(-)